MINANMKWYDCFLLGEQDEYGQPALSAAVGSIKMAIETTNQSIQDNILYNNATYIGFTHTPIDDKHVVNYEGKKLKVLYVNSKGRYNQVFLTDYVD